MNDPEFRLAIGGRVGLPGWISGSGLHPVWLTPA